MSDNVNKSADEIIGELERNLQSYLSELPKEVCEDVLHKVLSEDRESAYYGKVEEIKKLIQPLLEGDMQLIAVLFNPLTKERYPFSVSK